MIGKPLPPAELLGLLSDIPSDRPLICFADDQNGYSCEVDRFSPADGETIGEFCDRLQWALSRDVGENYLYSITSAD